MRMVCVHAPSSNKLVNADALRRPVASLRPGASRRLHARYTARTADFVNALARIAAAAVGGRPRPQSPRLQPSRTKSCTGSS